MPNALTRDVGFKVGPVLLEVLAKHYFEKRKEDGSTAEPVKLRKDEILFDEAFNLVKVSDTYGVPVFPLTDDPVLPKHGLLVCITISQHWDA